MAQRVQVVCDLDEVEATGTIDLALGKHQYRLDLCQSHQDDFYASIDKYLDVAQRVNGNSNGHVKSQRNGQAKAIRAWAVDNGIPVPMRGRIPAAVVEQYAALNR